MLVQDNLSQTLLEVMAGSLRWSGGRRLGRSITRLFRRRCAVEAKAKLSSLPCGRDLLLLGSLLGPSQFRDVVSAPRLAWRMFRPDFPSHDDEIELAVAISIDVPRFCPASTVDRNMYSARCDLVVAPGEPARTCGHRINGAPFIVDVEDTPNLFVKTGNASGTEVHPSDEIALLLDAVSKVMDVIRENCAQAYLFICDSVDILALRRRRASATFESGTFSDCAGFVLITNGHLGALEDFAEGLIHEAVHCALYKYEGVFGNFVLDPARRDDPVVSPWSGRTIRLHSFLHACFVWYGLLNFWRACERSAWNTPEVARRRAVAARGFQAKPATEILLPHQGVISGQLLRVLERIESLGRASSLDEQNWAAVSARSLSGASHESQGIRP